MRICEVRPRWLGHAKRAVAAQKLLDLPEITEKIEAEVCQMVSDYMIYGTGGVHVRWD
mgnify:CR=1 FL=1